MEQIKLTYSDGEITVMFDFPDKGLGETINSIYHFLRALSYSDEVIHKYIDIYGEITPDK